MTFTPTPYPAGSHAPSPTSGPTRRPLGFLRRWQSWTVAGLVLVLAVGWTMAFYNYGVSQDNAASTARLRDANAKLYEQLGAVIHERDQLQASRASAETALKNREDVVKQHEGELVQRDEAAKKREDAVKAREDAATQQEKVQAQNTITEGNWAVGVDIQPGTYRTKEAVSGDCYWEIDSDANGSNIVANDIVSGGRPTVTVRNGQYFTSERCGEWIKV